MSSRSSGDARARRARAQEAEAVAAIERTWPTSAGWTTAQLRQEAASPDALFFVVEAAGRVVSYALARKALDEAQIVAVGTAPEAARRGHGRAALEALLAAAREAGLKRAALEVSERNEPAKALYASSGFRVVGRRPKFYNDGSDALLLELAL